MKAESVLQEVLKERQRQDLKWGLQNHSPIEWIAILGEEFGEASKEALEHHFGAKWGYKQTNQCKTILAQYRLELIQVAAVAVAMIECLDRKHPTPQDNQEDKE